MLTAEISEDRRCRNTCRQNLYRSRSTLAFVMWLTPSQMLCHLCNIIMIQIHLFLSLLQLFTLVFFEHVCNICCFFQLLRKFPTCLDFSEMIRRGLAIMPASSLGWISPGLASLFISISLKYSITWSSSNMDGISLCCLNSATPENRSWQWKPGQSKYWLPQIPYEIPNACPCHHTMPTPFRSRSMFCLLFLWLPTYL